MEQQEILTKEEIAKVFAMYMDAKVRVCLYGYTTNINAISKGLISLDNSPTNNRPTAFVSQSVWGIRLLLRPLSAITDEDAIEVAKLSLFTGNPEAYVKVGKDIIERVINYKSYTHRRMVFCPEQYLFLISKGYAVPLFFAPNHWANGKTAIELGIAIDNTLNTEH